MVDASRLKCPLFGPSIGKDEEGHPSLLLAKMARLSFGMRLFVRVMGTVQSFLQRCGYSKALEREQKSGSFGHVGYPICRSAAFYRRSSVHETTCFRQKSHQWLL
jgi:hypothetical protein